MIDIQELTLELANAAKDGENHAILVAGQALAFWGGYYLPGDAPHNQLSPLASLDIDFFERRKERVLAYIEHAREVLDREGIRVDDIAFPSIDDHTINTALVQLKLPHQEEPLIIDFIHGIDGLKDTEVIKGSDKVIIGEVEFWVLNPVLCLKARIHNLLYLYPRLGRSGDKIRIECERVKAAILIVRLHLEDMLGNHPDQYRNVQNRVNVIIGIACRKMGRDLIDRYKMSVLDAIPRMGLKPEFYQYVLMDAKKKLMH